jgi:hypothetical protein
LKLESEQPVTEFLQVDLTLKEEQSDSVGQAVHRRSGGMLLEGYCEGLLERAEVQGMLGISKTRFFTLLW